MLVNMLTLLVLSVLYSSLVLEKSVMAFSAGNNHRRQCLQNVLLTFGGLQIFFMSSSCVFSVFSNSTFQMLSLYNVTNYEITLWLH